MTSELLRDMQSAAPLLVIIGTGLALMLIDAFAGGTRKEYLGWIGILGIAVTLGITASVWGAPGKEVGRLSASRLCCGRT